MRTRTKVILWAALLLFLYAVILNPEAMANKSESALGLLVYAIGQILHFVFLVFDWILSQVPG